MTISSRNHLSTLYSSAFIKECLDEEVYVYARNIKNPMQRILQRILLRRMRPGTRILYLIRKMQYNYHADNRLRRLYALHLHKKIWNESGCYISPLAIIGKGLHLPHPLGIVVGGAAEIGMNVSLYQNVTIGSRRKGDYEKGHQPHVQDGTICFSGSQILGDITIGRNSIIGAGAIVLSSVPSNSVSVGNPARIVNRH